MPSLISVVMPVYNGAGTLARAIQSLQMQTFSKWELLAVNDCSTDNSHEMLTAWSQRDDRIRPLCTGQNSGPGAARNLALRAARGEYVAYLDCDDEFYPEYLAQVARFARKGDVLVFQYDLEVQRPPERPQVFTWDPAVYRNHLFGYNPSIPLGVAHRKDLIAQAGAFDDRPWFQEDWDLWKRLARTGAQFLFLPFKSGLYHSLATSLTHAPRMSERQRHELLDNRARYDCVFPGHDGPHSQRQVRKLAFAAVHSMIDPSSGAAIATSDAMQLLAHSGFHCQAFGSAKLDFGEDVCFEQVLVEMGLPYAPKNVRIDDHRSRIVFTRKGDVPITVFRNQFTHTGPTASESAAFLTAYEKFLEKSRADALLTYGGDPITDLMIHLAKRRDIPVVFGLHNFSYHDVWHFRRVDYVVVPSEFSKEYYWEHLGLHCQVLPNVIDFARVKVGEHRPQYLTFVNPQPVKGLYVFARIAERIARRRPDIPILIVESRDRTRALERTGVDLSWARNLFGMANTTDPRQFYAVTRVMIMPSLWKESFGLVAAEAMINGVPVLASNRGALPEVVADGGLLFDIPARYTEYTTDVPTVEEVEPWVETVIRLWDDEEFYRQQSQRALGRARCWHPDNLRSLYVDFFRSLHPQPGPPIVLKSNPSSPQGVDCCQSGI